MAWSDTRGWRRFKRNRGALVGAGIVTLVVVAAILAPWIAPHPPNETYRSLTLTRLGVPIGPTRQFPLGADTVGRCEMSRLIYGARVSLEVAFAATALLALVGTLVGLLAGYFGRWLDAALMRFVDLLTSFPFLLIVMAINKAVRRPGVWVIFLVLGLLSWPGLSRQVRAKVLQVRELEYVTAARALGASHARILFRHILPNVFSVVVVISTMLVAEMIIAEAVLSYLGVGVVPPTASWGSMMSEGEALLRAVPRLLFVPGAAVVVTVVGFNLLGEGLRDALDPKG